VGETCFITKEVIFVLVDYQVIRNCSVFVAKSVLLSAE